MYIVDVLIEHPILSLDTTFSYLSNTLVLNNVRVKIPFNHRSIIGYVLECKETKLSVDELEKENGFKYQYIQSVIDEEPLLNDELIQLSDTISKLTLSPRISVLQAMLPSSLKPSSSSNVNIKYLKKITIISNLPAKTSKQNECLDYIKKHQNLYLKDLPYSSTIVDNLVKQNLIQIEEVEVYRDVETSSSLTKNIVQLTPLQQTAVNGIMSKKERVSLIRGVTGSGKTEVYLSLTKRILDQGKNVIMLVPEIALTPMMVEIFKNRFGNQVAILHSKLTSGQRYDEYRRIKRQEVRIVVGARSAVFAPIENIGLIILDEEHDGSYKQESMPRYSTTQIAKIRCQYHHASLVLGSATPSIESYSRAIKGVYDLYTMDERINKKPLPKVEVVDMLDEMKHKNFSSFSSLFRERLQSTIDSGHQAILLMNKRGYSSVVRCNDCGETIKCPHCDVTMTYHKSINRLKCHYCDYSSPLPYSCPKCNGNVKLIGQGTEKIEEEIEREFNNAKVIRYDVDTTRNKNTHTQLLEAFKNQEANVLVGTQMIAKGLDFENVTFVGVINADTGLNIPDYRSAERTFQLLTQVAGRSGRGKNEGSVIIQTFNPTHYAISDASHHDYLSFYQHELKYRQMAYYPPFCHMVSIVLTSSDVKLNNEISHEICNYLKSHLDNVKVLGPSDCVIYKMKDQYRKRIIIKFTDSKKIYPVLTQLLNYYNKRKVKLTIDFNPQTMM